MTDTVRNWLATGVERLKTATHEHMNLSSRSGLFSRLRRSKEARANFVSSHVDKTIAFQLRAIRDKQGLSQEKLAEMVGMNQNAISRLESEWYGKPTISTLKRLAAALDVALVVRFVPFTQLIDWVSGTPHVDKGLSTGALAVPSFAEEVRANAFREEEPIEQIFQLGVGHWFGAKTVSSGAYMTPFSGVVTGLAHLKSCNLLTLGENPPTDPFKIAGVDQSMAGVSLFAGAIQQAQEQKPAA